MKLDARRSLLSGTGPARRRVGAFSLVEIIASVAVVATLTGVGVTVVTSVKDNAAKMKLEDDVRAINAGATAFLASGGGFPPNATPDQVIGTLKKVATAAAAKRVVGFTGATVDLRLKAVNMTTSEASGRGWRAVWSTAGNRFVVARTGQGVKEFQLDNDAVPTTTATDTRATNYQFAATDSWVWDSGAESAPEARLNPDEVGTGTGTPPDLSPQGPAAKLRTPTSSVATGTYALSNFPQVVTLTNPNNAGTSILQYAVNGGAMTRYVGPFSTPPGATVDAVAVTVDPTSWLDSDPGNWVYQATPVKLAVTLTFAKTSFNYFEVGGAASGTSAAAILPARPGRLSVSNLSQIPLAYQSSSHFQPAWTYDGSNPLTSATRSTGPAFTNGYAGDSVPLSLAQWGNNATMVVTAGAAAAVPYLQSSDLKTATLRVSKLTLGAPVITATDTGVWGEKLVTLAPDTSVATPAGVRLYYTTDGVAPGDDGAGRPTSGTPYTAPFKLPLTAGSVKIIAKAFAPDSASAWFTPASAESTLAGAPPLDVYIGGTFAKADGSGRNIARLLPTGGLDTSFNPGSGATPGSVVAGVERVAAQVLAVGDFISVNGVPRTGIVRLESNGAVDTSFVPDIK